jgi:flagellar motility protein MotE (MotC chaperone)
VRDFRLIPIVLLATAGLFALKVLGLVFDGGYLLADTDPNPSKTVVKVQTQAANTSPTAVSALVPPPVRTKPLRMQDLFNLLDITGATESEKSAPAAKTEGAAPSKPDAAAGTKAEGTAKPAEATPGKPTEPTPTSDGTVIPITDHPVSSGERAILEHLQERRQELDARGRELEIRDNLVKEAESRLQAREAEVKEIEARINATSQKKDENDTARLKGLVVMYENMKARDAAKIFDRLDIKILVDLVTQMNPRRMSDIMAQMQPEMAERLTAELAVKGAGTEKTQSIENLPKIEGRHKAEAIGTGPGT